MDDGCYVSGGCMPTLADIYEEQAEECLRSAAKTENPKHRNMLLKLASAWRADAEALRRGAECAPSDAPAPTRRRRKG
jgi:hypothetical protein